MFTGIIQNIGFVDEIAGRQIAIRSDSAKSTQAGDSVAVNGVCLTASLVVPRKNIIVFDVMPETFKTTNLGSMTEEDMVNLEQALKLGDSMGGHLVTGHVDSVGIVKNFIDDKKEGRILTIAFPKKNARFIVPKGSITINGVSLTVAGVKGATFTTSIVEYTFNHTNFSDLQKGFEVNLEVDMISRYLAKIVDSKKAFEPQNV
jgi:riboflavin synthase